jgi:hypothetical protein
MNNQLLVTLLDIEGVNNFSARLHHHHQIHSLPLKAEPLEDQLFHSMYDNAENKALYSVIDWLGGSHKQAIDISFTEKVNCDLSIKSGVLKNKDKTTVISGGRLQKILGVEQDADFKTLWDKGGQNIVDYLNSNSEHTILCAPCKIKKEKNKIKSILYKLQYITGDCFTYPSFDKWNINKKVIEIILDNGIKVSIRPSLSWQIWWQIPTSLFNLIADINIEENHIGNFTYKTKTISKPEIIPSLNFELCENY